MNLYFHVMVFSKASFLHRNNRIIIIIIIIIIIYLDKSLICKFICAFEYTYGVEELD
jgi:hypothetical protein